MNILLSNTPLPKKSDKTLLTPDHIEILLHNRTIKISMESDQLIIEAVHDLNPKYNKPMRIWTDNRYKIKIIE